MRDTAEPPVTLNNPDEPQEAPAEKATADQTTATATIHTREIHLYTVPNRSASGHYADSGLYRDIIKNPALYMDRADF